MPTIRTKDGIEIFYKDWGHGQPVVFSHGWPLNADAWDEQLVFMAEHGYRAIAHDRGARSEGCGACGTFHRRGRSGALYRPPWEQAGSKGSAGRRRSSADAEDR